MTPVSWLVLMLVIVTLIYTGTAVAYQLADRPGMALAFLGYMLANIGLIFDVLGTK
jgi:hypothetical protein